MRTVQSLHRLINTLYIPFPRFHSHLHFLQYSVKIPLLILSIPSSIHFFQTSSRNEEGENDLQLGVSVIDNLLTGRRQSNGLARRGSDSGNRRIVDGGRRNSASTSSSTFRRESGTLFHPLSNLIHTPTTDLITTSALPRSDTSNTHLGSLHLYCYF